VPGAFGRPDLCWCYLQANPKTDEQEASVRVHYEKAKYGLHPAESYVNSDLPRIRRMVSKLVEWGFETSKV